MIELCRRIRCTVAGGTPIVNSRVAHEWQRSCTRSCGTSARAHCPRHATPPPSPNSAKPSTTPTPNTRAPTSRCATASNPTSDRTRITKPCQFSSSLRGRRGCGKIRSGRSLRSLLLGAAEAVCQFDPGSRVDGAANCIATSTRVRLKPDTRSAPAGDLPMVKVVAVEGK